MKEEDTIHSDVLDYFNAEFDALEERLKNGGLVDYRERVLVSRKIDEAIGLLSPYVRSDPRTRYLVKSAELLKKELLSVREEFVNHLLLRKDQQSLLQAVIDHQREQEGSVEELTH